MVPTCRRNVGSAAIDGAAGDSIVGNWCCCLVPTWHAVPATTIMW
jgi:hypothetical protein